MFRNRGDCAGAASILRRQGIEDKATMNGNCFWRSFTSLSSAVMNGQPVAAFARP